MARARPDDEVSTILRSRVDTSEELMTFALVAVEGPDRGLRVVLDGPQPSRVLVGQSPVCAIRLSDKEVSRRHAAFELTERGLRLTDLQSTNGTFADGMNVVDVYLRGGESIRLGQTVLRVEPLASRTSPATSTATSFGRVVGASAEMRRLYPLCERLAATDLAVLIEGETGTGKELLAESLHEQSGRAAKPFVVLDCTAVAPNLVESALFGHEVGAFTGATAARRGVFEQAHGGTLLIDEIGDLDLALQPKLLRAIERSEVQRVGAAGWTRVDVRVIAATRRDLDREVQAGKFRDDLFFRVAITRIELPPLRRRRGDIALLARQFWDDLGGADRPIPYEVFQRYEEYEWPGNVRELHNTVARQLALGELADLEPSRRPGNSVAPSADVVEQVLGLRLPLPVARQRMVEEFERRYLERVLAEHDGNIAKACAASGIARRYFMLLRSRRGL